MTTRRALSVREVLATVREHTPDRYHECTRRLSRQEVGYDFAVRFAGIPASSRARSEDVVLYANLDDARMPVVLGLYGDAERVRGWLPGLPRRTNRETAGALLDAVRGPELAERPACQEWVSAGGVDLGCLPVLQTTPRDAGPYVTMGMVYARDGRTGEVALSVHRMLVLDHSRLTIWMVPGRQLRAMHQAAAGRGERLPVSINIGAPPAAVIASALNTRFLPGEPGGPGVHGGPAGITKLDVAGALAGAPVAIAPALSQPTSVLADSEIVLEGFLGDAVADECLAGAPKGSLPEFLGYDGSARSDLPVVTVTAMTTRRDPVYQAVIGPGREQSVMLGLAGALSVALSGDDAGWRMVRDLHLSPAGGGMLLLVIAVRKDRPASDGHLEGIARRVFEQHPFVKLIIFTDDDVDITSAEDVLWAVTTRANLGSDCTTVSGFPRLAMDPSQSEEWAAARNGAGSPGRTFVDATVPYQLIDRVARSFPSMVPVDGPEVKP